MEQRVNGVLIHYADYGDGVPLVSLHGAGVDHREIEAAIEALPPIASYRRIYPDLPGMGHSTTEGLHSNNDVVAQIAAFIEQLQAGPVLLLGHSYGAYLARGVAARRPELLLGLALLCPLGGDAHPVPWHQVVRQDADAHNELEAGQREGFYEYFVVRTRATARRYRDHVVPGAALVDEDGLGRIFSDWTVDVGSGTFPAPTLVVAGRSDSTVGHLDAMDLLGQYPHATLAVVDGAGHALMHERPGLLAGLIEDWLGRVGVLAAQD